MYYIKWRDEPDKYLKVGAPQLGTYAWGSLKIARSFTSAMAARASIDISGCSHWLEYSDAVFIHPLNFEALVASGRG